jgi:hypothetical protein
LTAISASNFEVYDDPEGDVAINYESNPDGMIQN